MNFLPDVLCLVLSCRTVTSTPMIMAASVYATPPPDLSGEEAALSDASNSSQTNSSHGSTLKASKRTLSSSFLNATTANTTQSSTITTTSSSQQSSDSLPDLSKKRRKQSMPIRFATNGTVIEPSSVPGGETEAVAGRLAESGARSEPLGQSERDRRTPNDADDDEEDDGCQSPNAPSPAMETDQEPDSDGAALLEQQQNNFQKIFLSNLSQLQQKHLQLQQQQQQHAAGESGLGSPGTASLPDSFLASKLTSLISLSTGRGMTKSDDEQEPDEPEHRPSVDMVGSNPRSFNSKEHYNGSVESEELKAYHEESLRAGSENHGSIGHGDRSSNHSPSPMMSNPPKLSLKKELMFDPEWDGEIRSNLPKPEDWMSIAGLSFPFPPEAAAALSASGYLPQLPLLGVPTVSPFGGGAGSTDGTNRPSVPPLRIFNPEAYCDLCNKEFCNKYFLKTHKANKHGIYEPAANSSNNPSDNNPPAFSALMNPFNPIHQLSQVFQMQQQQQQQQQQHSGTASSSSEQSSGGQNTVAGHQNLGRDSDSQVSQQSPAMSQAPGHQQSSGPPAPPTSRTTSLSPKTPTNSTAALIQPTVFCDICFKKFSSLSAMRKHRSKAHELANQSNHQQQLQQQLQQHHQQQLQQQQQQLQQQLHQHLQQQHQHYQQQLHARSVDGVKHESSADGGVPGNNEGATGPAGASTGGPFQLPDGFREDYMVEQEDTSFTPQPRKLSPHSMQAAKDANFSADKLKRLGVINTEAFCEICCKEYCNKYFLRTHKLKRHGILPTADELKEERNLPPWVPFMQTSPLNLIMGGSAATAADMVSAQMALQASSPSSLKKFMVAAAAASAAGELAANGADTNLGTIDGSNGGSSVSPLEIKQELQGKGRGMSNGDGPDMQGSSSDAGAGGDGDDRNSTGPAGQKDIGSDEDAEAISVDLQKLQSMIMQLNDLNNQHQRKMGCGVCGKELANQYLLHAHMIQEHGPLGENNNGGLKGSREPTPLASITSTGTPVGPGTGDTMEVCKQCDKEFSNEFLLKQHLIEVHGLPSIPSPKREGFITPERRTTGGNSGGGTTGSTTAGTASGPPPAPNYNDRKPTFSMTPTSSYCEICNKELCNKYFMKTHMQRMHGIEIENGAQIGGVVCNICNKELCSKYFLRVHKHNTHGIVEEGAPLPQARQNGGAAASSGAAGADSPMMGTGGPDHSNDGTDPSGLLKPGEITDTSNRYYSHFTEVCPLCSRRFRSAKWLRAHLLSDHGKPGVDKLKELEQKLANGPGSVGQTGASNGGGRSKSNSPSLKVPNGSGGAGGMVEPKFNPKSPFGAISPAEAAKFLPKGAGIPGLFGTEQTPSPMGGMKGYQCSFCTFATPLLPLLFIHERSHSSLTIVQQQLLQQQQQQHHQQQQQQQQQQSDEGLGSPMGEATFPSLLKSESAVSLAKEHSAHHQTLPGTNSSSVGSSSETPSSTPASTPVPSLSQEALHLQQQHQQQRSRSGSRYELRQSPDPESTSRMTELRHLKTSSPKMASAPSPATGGGGEPNAMLTEMANITQRPAIYALPQQSGPLMMQSFLIEESASSPSFGAAGNRSPKDALAGLTGQQDHRFVPAVVFLPVKERILTPMTISFNLSPA
ncbi:uncharacterized protein LOC118459046 [Anopheles albimanus]|uniref:uncharacterized protein LOC118459046 n=1 Tax=Anopheles albimanus TaxID=7167 RepID=UPI0016422871|nr:uncharacterized protein LOC118459046 [Anopheles albimanus]